MKAIMPLLRFWRPDFWNRSAGPNLLLPGEPAPTMAMRRRRTGLVEAAPPACIERPGYR
jgi:hypothetical protein